MTEQDPEVPTTRRAARALRDGAVAPPTPHNPGRRRDAARPRAGHDDPLLPAATASTADTGRHGRSAFWKRIAVFAGIPLAAAVVLGSSSAITAGLASASGAVDAPDVTARTVTTGRLAALPVPRQDAVAPTTDICTLEAVAAALATGDDEAAVRAAGGGTPFRDALVGGTASCVDLGDADRQWVVVDKLRPFDPIDHRPTTLVMPDGVRNIAGGSLDAEAAAAMSAMVRAARDAGAGDIGIESAFRSYQTQRSTYNRHVANFGVDHADKVSARPGYSEHQTGLAADVVPCSSSGACGSIDDLAATSQGQWVAAHSWEYGWIVRYVDGAEGATGYLAEPWHLRYIGPELARAYHEGGWHSLEEFFGLDPAADYAG